METVSPTSPSLPTGGNVHPWTKEIVLESAMLLHELNPLLKLLSESQSTSYKSQRIETLQNLLKILENANAKALHPLFDFLTIPVISRMGQVATALLPPTKSSYNTSSTGTTDKHLSDNSSLLCESQQLFKVLRVLFERSPATVKEYRSRSKPSLLLFRCITPTLRILDTTDLSKSEECCLEAFELIRTLFERLWTLIEILEPNSLAYLMDETPQNRNSASSPPIILGFCIHVILQHVEIWKNNIKLLHCLHKNLQNFVRCVSNESIIACYYPGVIIGTTKFILQCKHTLGSTAFATAIDTLRMWVSTVLSDTRYKQFLYVHEPFEMLINQYKHLTLTAGGVNGIQENKYKAGTCSDSQASSEATSKGDTKSKAWLEDAVKNTETVIKTLFERDWPCWILEKTNFRTALFKLASTTLKTSRNIFAFFSSSATHLLLQELIRSVGDESETISSEALQFLLPKPKDRSHSALFKELDIQNAAKSIFITSLESISKGMNGALSEDTNPPFQSRKAFLLKVRYVQGFVKLLREQKNAFDRGGSSERMYGELDSLITATEIGRALQSLCNLDPVIIQDILIDNTRLPIYPEALQIFRSDALTPLLTLPKSESIAVRGNGTSSKKLEAQQVNKMELLASQQSDIVSSASELNIEETLESSIAVAEGDRETAVVIADTCRQLTALYGPRKHAQIVTSILRLEKCCWEVEDTVREDGEKWLRGFKGDLIDSVFTDSALKNETIWHNAGPNRIDGNTLLQRCAALYSISLILDNYNAASPVVETTNVDGVNSNSAFNESLPMIRAMESFIELLVDNCMTASQEELASQLVSGDATIKDGGRETQMLLNLYYSSIVFTITKSLKALHALAGASAVDKQMKYLLFPLLQFLDCHSYIVSMAAWKCIEELPPLLDGNTRESISPTIVRSLSNTAYGSKESADTLCLYDMSGGKSGDVSIEKLGSREDSLAYKWVLQRYSDYLLDSIALQLPHMFYNNRIQTSNTSGATIGMFSSLLTSVVVFSPFSLIPSFVDIVETLVSTKWHVTNKVLGAGSPLSDNGIEIFDTPLWNVRSLASISYFLASKLSADRLISHKENEDEFGVGLLKMKPLIQDIKGWPLRVKACRPSNSGWDTKRTHATIESPLDGSLAENQSSVILTMLINEDAPNENSGEGNSLSTECGESSSINQLDGTKQKKRTVTSIKPLQPFAQYGKYGLLRYMATAILIRMRYLLQDKRLPVRYYAHFTTLNTLYILSTRMSELLPRLHEIWPSLIQSFEEETPLPIVTIALPILKFAAFVAGDFIRDRFTDDIFNHLKSRLLKMKHPSTEAEYRNRTLEYKFELACLEAFSFLSMIPSLIQRTVKSLTAIALTFLCKTCAETLKMQSKIIIGNCYKAMSHVTWIICHSAETVATQLVSIHPNAIGSSKGPQQEMKKALQLLCYSTGLSMDECLALCKSLDREALVATMQQFKAADSALEQKAKIYAAGSLFEKWFATITAQE